MTLDDSPEAAGKSYGHNLYDNFVDFVSGQSSEFSHYFYFGDEKNDNSFAVRMHRKASATLTDLIAAHGPNPVMEIPFEDDEPDQLSVIETVDLSKVGWTVWASGSLAVYGEIRDGQHLTYASVVYPQPNPDAEI
ncbi:MAG TPA: hypothetical protein VHB51_03390 [Candidatus Saccharimonadales bacterium]|nr:hypothetical protein [Candidatus Saccharimonadales bacterium]